MDRGRCGQTKSSRHYVQRPTLTLQVQIRRALLFVGLAAAAACSSSTETRAREVVDTDWIAGTWDLRVVGYSRYNPTNGCVIDRDDPGCSDDTLSVAVVTGPVVLGPLQNAEAINRTMPSSGEAVTTATLAGKLYPSVPTLESAECTGKPLSCWTALPAKTLTPTVEPFRVLRSNTGQVTYILHVAYGLTLGAGSHQTSGKILSAPTTELHPTVLYDSTASGVFELRRR